MLSISLRWMNGRILNSQSKNSATRSDISEDAIIFTFILTLHTNEFPYILDLQYLNLPHPPSGILKQWHCKYQQIHLC
jgi:hypothetical protein